jgi:hypothetical protein
MVEAPVEEYFRNVGVFEDNLARSQTRPSWT